MQLHFVPFIPRVTVDQSKQPFVIKHNSMENTKKVVVLGAFAANLPILQISNAENFDCHDRNRFARNCWLSCSVVMAATSMLFVLILSMWYILFDNGVAMGVIAATTPSSLTLFQLFITFVALVLKNRFITGTIERIQQVTEQRRYC